jgi:hypothetical protein
MFSQVLVCGCQLRSRLNDLGIASTVSRIALLILLGISLNCKTPIPPDDLKTVDSTSHRVVWKIDTLGAESSSLNDIFVINDTLAYAVGELYPRDSAGHPILTDIHNAAIWNGKIWRMIKVPYIYQGTPFYNPIITVFGFGPNDVWFAGNGLVHWNGAQYTNVDAVNTYWVGHLMRRIWGSSGRDLYIVGDGGIAVHFDGTWHAISTGTTLPFQDIWGSNLSNNEVLAVASDKFGAGGLYVAQFNSNSPSRALDTVPTAVSLSGIWFVQNDKYLLVGDGIFEKHLLSDPAWLLDPFVHDINQYPFAVRGNAANDVFIACNNGIVAHFNGVNWRRYDEVQNINDRLLSISVKGNIVIAVGLRYYDGFRNYGVIYNGSR